jgi:alanine dehydrogenase
VTGTDDRRAVRVLSDEDVAECLDLETLLPAVADALCAQGRGEVERPERPHLPIGEGAVPPEGGDPNPEPCGTGLVMPAYVHGSPYYASKTVSVVDANPARGLSTVNAAISLTDSRTGLPVAYLAGNRLTNARTACIGGLAARELAADAPVRVGVIGAGTQARWQVRGIAAATDVGSVRVYSPSDSRAACAADLRKEGIDCEAVESAAAAVRGASVVVTATTATAPVLDGDDLAPGTVVVAVGAYTPETRELDDRTVDRAAELFADVPEEAAETGDFPNHGADDLTPFSAVLEGVAGRKRPDDVLVVASVGTAVLDAAAAELIYGTAVEDGVGLETTL